MRAHAEQRAEADLHFAAEVGNNACGRTFERHMGHLGFCHVVKQLAGQMLQAAGTRGTVVQFARVGLGIGNQFSDVFRRYGRIQVDRVKQRSRLRNALQILGQVVRQIGIGRRIDVHGRGNQADRVTVGGGFGGEINTDRAGGTRAVIDDDLLVPLVAEMFGDHACGGIGAGARRERSDQAHRLVRIILGRIGGPAGQSRRCKHRNGQCAGNAFEIQQHDDSPVWKWPSGLADSRSATDLPQR